MYDNVIIHDLDKNAEIFFDIVALVIKSTIEKFYEKDIIKNIIKRNYFYLDEIEQEYIFKISNQIMYLPDSKIGYKNRILKEIIINYITENKSMILDGFMIFRAKEYKNLLENIVEVSVVSFLELTSF